MKAAALRERRAVRATPDCGCARGQGEPELLLGSAELYRSVTVLCRAGQTPAPRGVHWAVFTGEEDTVLGRTLALSQISESFASNSTYEA